jgi:GntR family transcriptional repressor for pyruvate dehydrogenase complex
MPAYRDDDPSRVRLEFETMPKGTAVSEVVKQLTSLLTGGDLAPGSRLPPERQLAESLGVGRSAVREALAALEILGIVSVRPGSGTYMRDSMSELLPTALSWGLMLSASHTEQLIELRGGLEAQAAELAAQRIDEAGIEKLRRHVETMSENIDDFEKFIEADVRFHLQIATSSGNEVLRDLLQSVRSLLRLWVERGLRNAGQAQEAYREHVAVFEAIAARDPRLAESSMRAHMKTAAARVGTVAAEVNHARPKPSLP